MFIKFDNVYINKEYVVTFTADKWYRPESKGSKILIGYYIQILLVGEDSPQEMEFSLEQHETWQFHKQRLKEELGIE